MPLQYPGSWGGCLVLRPLSSSDYQWLLLVRTKVTVDFCLTLKNVAWAWYERTEYKSAPASVACWWLTLCAWMKRRLSVTNLSSENNLLVFWLNAPVGIKAKVKLYAYSFLTIVQNEVKSSVVTHSAILSTRQFCMISAPISVCYTERALTTSLSTGTPVYLFMHQ